MYLMSRNNFGAVVVMTTGPFSKETLFQNTFFPDNLKLHAFGPRVGVSCLQDEEFSIRFCVVCS